jgi:hypothetical protein
VVIVRLPSNSIGQLPGKLLLYRLFSHGHDTAVILDHGGQLWVRANQADRVLAIATANIDECRSVREMIEREDELDWHVQGAIVVARHSS